MVTLLVALLKYKGVDFTRNHFTADEQLGIAIFFLILGFILQVGSFIFYESKEKDYKRQEYILIIVGFTCRFIMFVSLSYLSAYFLEVVNNDNLYIISLAFFLICTERQWKILDKYNL
jgi:amino acid transporter